MSPTLEAQPLAPASQPSLTKKTVWSALASLLHLLGAFVCTVLVSRLLGVRGTGQVAYLLWLSDMAITVATLGLAQGLTTQLAEAAGRRGEADSPLAFVRWVSTRYLAVTAAGAVLLGALGPHIASGGFPGPTWAALALLFLARSLEALCRAQLTGLQRFDRLARVNTVGSLARIGGVAIGASLAGVDGSILGYAAGALVPAALGLAALRGPRVPPSPEARRRLRSYSLYAWIAALVGAVLWSRMEVFYIERHWDGAEVAMFATGISFATVATGAPLMLAGALVPHFAEKHGARDLAAIEATHTAATRMLAFLLFPLCLGTAAILPALVPMFLGPTFSAAVPTAMVLVAFSALSYASVGSSLMYGVGRVRFAAFAGCVGSGVALAVYAVVIPAHGAWGAAWARSAIQLALVVWGHVYTARKLACPPPVGALLRTAAAAALCGAVAYVPVALSPRPVALVAAIPLGAIVYLLSARLLRALTPADAARLAAMAERLPGPIGRPVRTIIAWTGVAR